MKKIDITTSPWSYGWMSIIQNSWKTDDVEQRWVNFKFGFIVIVNNTCEQNLCVQLSLLSRIQTISCFASKHCIQSVMKKKKNQKKAKDIAARVHVPNPPPSHPLPFLTLSLDAAYSIPRAFCNWNVRLHKTKCVGCINSFWKYRKKGGAMIPIVHP